MSYWAISLALLPTHLHSGQPVLHTWRSILAAPAGHPVFYVRRPVIATNAYWPHPAWGADRTFIEKRAHRSASKATRGSGVKRHGAAWSACNSKYWILILNLEATLSQNGMAAEAGRKQAAQKKASNSSIIGGFDVTSSPPCWWTKTKDLSLAPFVCPPAIVHCSIVICVSRDRLQTTFTI